MDPLLDRLGARVRDSRTARRLSLRALAEQSGVSLRFLGELERGRGNVSILTLQKVAGALGTSAASLLSAAEAGRPRRVIALLGLRGAGKSTIGARLASRLHLPFFELDGLVEAAAGLALPELFALHGEGAYRRWELEALDRFLARHDDAVLATGGGIVTHDAAMERLQNRTTTVWLRASADAHWTRVRGQGDERPMADRPQAREELGGLLAQREPLYARAALQVDTEKLGVRGAVDELARQLRTEPT